MQSTIFLNNLTVIDYAYIDENSKLIGDSLQASFLVSGETDPTEKVVVDFSTIKKDIKGLIDGHKEYNSFNGFDHKLLVISDNPIINSYKKSVSYVIHSPSFFCELPLDAVKIIKTKNMLNIHIENFLLEHLSLKYPNINLQIKCILDNNFILPYLEDDRVTYPFRYIHGLKDSTSYGCQNLIHGHYSFLNIPIKYQNEEFLNLNNIIFINSDNIISKTNDIIEVGYNTPQRGNFYARFNLNMNKIIILETETTIEFLSSYFKNIYNLTDFYISEGLTKGAYLS